MNSTEISRQLLARGLLFVAAVVIYGFSRGAWLAALPASDAEGLNTLILLLGSIYAVMYAFVIYVIWGQFTDVERFVMRECYSLNDLMRFSYYVNPDASRAIRRAVADYSEAVLQSEWQALSERQKDFGTEKCFTNLMTTVIRIPDATAEEETMRQRLIDIAREAGEHRDERITKSLTRIPSTLMGFVHALSVALALLVFVYPFHHPLYGLACFALVFAILILANMVMTDLDNPFSGIYNATAEPFTRLK
jgi:Protein of unknown function (DUF4239)